ncbi:MAG TPA: amidohydrolase family protein [Paenalcaligenes sp.]|nr:amidohydrolase family protein [Paenalcaligenes sp.]
MNQAKKSQLNKKDHPKDLFSQYINERAHSDLRRRLLLGGAAFAATAFAGLNPLRRTWADSLLKSTADRPIVLTNLKLFDGTGSAPQKGLQVLIVGNKVQDILEQDADTPEQAHVIDCAGKLLMPGLIDMHWHSMLAGLNQTRALTSPIGYLYYTAAAEAERTLMRGFTTIRDAGGPSFALKSAIDEGLISGPRIYPSGAMITQTSGHGDFRFINELPRDSWANTSFIERAGVAMIADGRAEVLRRVREQLMQGASQIKMLAGGGVASLYDPLNSVQFTEDELTAAVQAAEDYDTYVMTHVYMPKGIQRAIRSGVQCIEHGQLADEESVKMMQDHGVWWSLQPFLQDKDSNEYVNPVQIADQKRVAEGTVRAYELAQKYDINTGWGTDILFNPKKTSTQGAQLAKLTRFYDPLVLLRQATAQNARMLALSRTRNPYPGLLGEIAPGAYADLIIADGDPTKDIDFVSDPEKNFHIIMKDGVIYKNTL